MQTVNGSRKRKSWKNVIKSRLNSEQKKSPQGQTFHLNYCEIYYGKHYSFSRIFPKTVKSTHQIHLHEFFHNFSQETLSNFLYKQVSKNLQLERQKKVRILSSFKAFFDFTKVFNHRLCPLKMSFMRQQTLSLFSQNVFSRHFLLQIDWISQKFQEFADGIRHILEWQTTVTSKTHRFSADL